MLPEKSGQTDMVAEIARGIAGEVQPGWDSLRYQAEAVGNVTSDLIYVMRGEDEERVYAPDEMPETLQLLKKMMHTADGGTWVSLSMTIATTSGLSVDYNYADKPDFGFDVSAHDYRLELERFPRAEASVPSWWRERIARGDGAERTALGDR
jgi:hypothetical protein